MAETKDRPPDQDQKPGGKKNSTSEEEITEYVDSARNVTYCIGDTVYIESQRNDMPYFICTIRNFNRSKKDNISVDVCWLYRPCEIPTSVYELLSQVRSEFQYGGEGFIIMCYNVLISEMCLEIYREMTDHL